MTKVHHIPDSKRNLISLSTLESLGYRFSAQGGVLKVTKGALVVMKATKSGSLYVLQGHTVTGSTTISSSFIDSGHTHLWHKRLGHMSEKGMDILSKRGLLGSPGTGKLEFCEHCVYREQKKVRFSTATHRKKGILDYVHSDLWGPSRVASYSGKCYFMSIIDDFSRKVWIYFLRRKK